MIFDWRSHCLAFLDWVNALIECKCVVIGGGRRVGGVRRQRGKRRFARKAESVSTGILMVIGCDASKLQ